MKPGLQGRVEAWGATLWVRWEKRWQSVGRCMLAVEHTTHEPHSAGGWVEGRVEVFSRLVGGGLQPQ